MKTVGQLLHSERIKKNLSIEDLSLATKIDGKYIERLEEDRYDLLPSETFIKGFIRNLSLNLGVNPEELIAIFRRDFRHPPAKKNSPLKHRIFSFRLPSMSSQLSLIILGVTIFIIYLGFQFRAILTLPPLHIDKPIIGSVLASPVLVQGTTSTDSLVTINNDNVIKPDQNGTFQISLSLPVGETSLHIKTTNRFGKSRIVQIPLTIISN